MTSKNKRKLQLIFQDLKSRDFVLTAFLLVGLSFGVRVFSLRDSFWTRSLDVFSPATFPFTAFNRSVVEYGHLKFRHTRIFLYFENGQVRRVPFLNAFSKFNGSHRAQIVFQRAVSSIFFPKDEFKFEFSKRLFCQSSSKMLRDVGLTDSATGVISKFAIEMSLNGRPERVEHACQ